MTESIEEIHRIGDEDVILAISFPRYSVRQFRQFLLQRTVRRRLLRLQMVRSHRWPLMRTVQFIANSDMVSFVDSLVAPLSVVNALLAALSMRYKDSVTDTMLSMESIWNTMNEYEHID